MAAFKWRRVYLVLHSAFADQGHDSGSRRELSNPFRALPTTSAAFDFYSSEICCHLLGAINNSNSLFLPPPFLDNLVSNYVELVPAQHTRAWYAPETADAHTRSETSSPRNWFILCILAFDCHHSSNDGPSSATPSWERVLYCTGRFQTRLYRSSRAGAARATDTRARRELKRDGWQAGETWHERERCGYTQEWGVWKSPGSRRHTGTCTKGGSRTETDERFDSRGGPAPCAHSRRKVRPRISECCLIGQGLIEFVRVIGTKTCFILSLRKSPSAWSCVHSWRHTRRTCCS